MEYRDLYNLIHTGVHTRGEGRGTRSSISAKANSPKKFHIQKGISTAICKIVVAKSSTVKPEILAIFKFNESEYLWHSIQTPNSKICAYLVQGSYFYRSKQFFYLSLWQFCATKTQSLYYRGKLKLDQSVLSSLATLVLWRMLLRKLFGGQALDSANNLPILNFKPPMIKT